MSQTDQNLKDAFAGESQANRRYLAYAKAADDEGKPQIARLFRAAAAAETIHAHAHLKALGGVGDTLANLKDAVAGETYECTRMYPEFVKVAEGEKDEKALKMFRWANAVEQIHAKLFQKSLDTAAAGKTVPVTRIFVCQVCGNTVEGEAPDKCPVCNSGKKGFKEIE